MSTFVALASALALFGLGLVGYRLTAGRWIGLRELFWRLDAASPARLSWPQAVFLAVLLIALLIVEVTR